MDEIILSRVLALKTRADAINAELMAMNLNNAELEKMNKAPAHVPNEFLFKSDELNGIATELDQFARG